jgi:chorismate mutase
MSTIEPRETRRVIALRGATTVEHDDRGEIIAATSELLRTLMDRNGLSPDDLISMIFTATPDISAAFPAAAARAIGLADVPLLCSVEIAVPESIPCCIRVLVHLSWPGGSGGPRHVYLGRARELRTDLDV